MSKDAMKNLVAAMDNMGANIGDAMRNNEEGFYEQMNMHNTPQGAIAQQAKFIAEREIQEIYGGLIHGTMAAPVIFEDPDQSPLSGLSAQILRNKWVSGMDMLPHVPLFRHLSPWLLDIYLGNFDNFMQHVNSLSAEDLDRQLKKRETMLHTGGIFHVVIGARNIFEGSPLLEETVQHRGLPGMNHIRIFEKLLQLGAEVNVHDFAGYTPLHHCLTSAGNETTFAMAKVLLGKGANPNAQNRFGCTPLVESVMTHNKEFVSLLVKNGADPHIKDFEGISAFDVGKHFPGIQKLMKKADRKIIQEERKEAKKETLQRCSGCDNAGKKRCTGCFLEWYCSVECQQGDWKNHKSACKERKSKYVAIEFVQGTSSSSYNFKTESVVSTSSPVSRSAASSFVVKVQTAAPGQPLLIYNKDKTVNGLLPSTKNFGLILANVVRNEGFKGAKGFFYAMKQRGQVLINPSILPPETW